MGKPFFRGISCLKSSWLSENKGRKGINSINNSIIHRVLSKKNRQKPGAPDTKKRSNHAVSKERVIILRAISIRV
jgi:hypothetical protein